MSKSKMTGPRRALLGDLLERWRPVHATYPPLLWLLAEGFVEKREVGISTVYSATETGRAAYAASST